MKNILILFITGILLTSCGTKEDISKQTTENTTSTASNVVVNTQVDQQIVGQGIEQRNQVMLNDVVNTDEKQLLETYLKAKSVGDIITSDKLLIQINELIAKKENQLIEYENNGETEKAIELKKELRSFRVLIRR